MYKTLNQKLKEKIDWETKGFRNEKDWYNLVLTLERKNYFLVNNAANDLIRTGKRTKTILNATI